MLSIIILEINGLKLAKRMEWNSNPLIFFIKQNRLIIKTEINCDSLIISRLDYHTNNFFSDNFSKETIGPSEVKHTRYRQ